jgi:hypothetical protein
MRSSLQFVSAFLFSLLLGGCATDGGSRTAASSVDENSPEVRRKLMKLYAGTEYMDLASRLGTPSYLRRTMTVEAPEPHGVKPVATVTVVYVWEENRVREPRVFESSDPRFDEGALKELHKFDSYPGRSKVAMPLFVFVKVRAYKVVESEEMRKSGTSRETTAAALGMAP